MEQLLYPLALLPITLLIMLGFQLDAAFDRRETQTPTFEAEVLRDLKWLCEKPERVAYLRGVPVIPAEGMARRSVWRRVSQRVLRR